MVKFGLVDREKRELGKCQYNETKCPNVIDVLSSGITISFIVDDINLCKICKYYSQGFIMNDSIGRLTI
jgi:hypothetical protein